MPTHDLRLWFPRPRALRRGNFARTLVAAAAALASAGCMSDPAAPLIPTKARPATALPTEVSALDADGYPNVLADPSSVPGLPRTARSVASAEAALVTEARRNEAATAGIRRPSFADDLSRRARTHVDEARRAIEATGRPSVPGIQDVELLEGPALRSGAQPAASAPAPARPLDPDEPLPRAVGVPRFRGEADGN